MRFSSAWTEVKKRDQEVTQQTKKMISFCIMKTKSDIFNELVLYLFILL